MRSKIKWLNGIGINVEGIARQTNCFSSMVSRLGSNIRVCFMSAADLNMEALREVYPGVSFGSFIKKPVEIEYLAKRLLAELS